MADHLRTNRDSDARQASERKAAWAPPQILPEPKPIPGYAFRWIRTAIMGQFDPTNTSAKLREGWEPCKAEDHPEMMLYADPTSRFKGNVEVGGLMLCKTPKEMVDQRAAWFRNQTKSQIEAVDSSYMKNNNPMMPLFAEHKSSTSFGRGGK